MPLPVQQFPFHTYEEEHPFLSQLTKGLDLTKGMMKFPGEMEQQRIANALKNIELQYAPQTAKSELAYKNALASLYGQQAKYYPQLTEAQIKDAQALAQFRLEESAQKKWEREHGYPTPDLRTIQGLEELSRRNLAYSPITQTQVSPIPTPAPVSAPALGKTTLPSQLKALPTAIQKSQENAALDSSIYVGQEPNMGLMPGFSPLAQSYIASKFPDPMAEYRRNIASEEVKNNLSMLKEKQDTISKEASAANSLIPTVTKAENLYDKIKLERGRLGGKFPSFMSDEASEFDKIIQDIVNQNAAIIGKGRVFGYDFTASAGSKISRDLPENAFIGLATTQKSKAEDAIEKQAFYSTGGARRPDGTYIREPKLDQAWNVYKRIRPSMNTEPGQFYKNNAFQNTWKDFLTPEALRSIEKDGVYIPPNQKMLANQNIKANDINQFHNVLKTVDPKISKLGTIKIIENPDLLNDIEFNKIKNKIPKNIIIQMIRTKLQQGD